MTIADNSKLVFIPTYYNIGCTYAIFQKSWSSTKGIYFDELLSIKGDEQKNNQLK